MEQIINTESLREDLVEAAMDFNPSLTKTQAAVHFTPAIIDECIEQMFDAESTFFHAFAKQYLTTIPQQVENNVITTCCFDCASKHRTETTNSYTATISRGTCQICNKQTFVTSAAKLFGYHKFI